MEPGWFAVSLFMDAFQMDRPEACYFGNTCGPVAGWSIHQFHIVRIADKARYIRVFIKGITSSITLHRFADHPLFFFQQTIG
jgi:hypothetical protein